jgi:hypothetical protein
MMKTSCPEPDRLADLRVEGPDDLELRAHVASCNACRGTVWLYREIRNVFPPELPISERLVLRGLVGIERGESPPPLPRTESQSETAEGRDERADTPEPDDAPDSLESATSSAADDRRRAASTR